MTYHVVMNFDIDEDDDAGTRAGKCAAAIFAALDALPVLNEFQSFNKLVEWTAADLLVLLGERVESEVGQKMTEQFRKAAGQ